MERITEPELMEGEEQCLEYNSTNLRASNNSHLLNLYKQYCNCSKGVLVDLGCGPSHHLTKLSTEYPNLTIIGYDGSQAMVDYANKNIAGYNNIAVKKSLFNNIEGVADCVISSQTLHHQHDPISFWETVKRLLPSCIFVVDFERPADHSVIDKVSSDSKIAEDDLKNSLLASFTKEEVEEQLKQVGLDLTVVSQPITFNGEPTFLNCLVIFTNKDKEHRSLKQHSL